MVVDEKTSQGMDSPLRQVEPPGFGAVDARARSHTRNGISGDDERYFLIEVVSELAAYARRRDALAAGQSHLTGKLAEIVKGCDKGKEESMALLDLSLRGHHVGYWAPGVNPDGKYATVNVMPAIVAASRNQTISDARDGLGVPRPPKIPSFFDDDKGTRPHDSVAPERLFAKHWSPFGYPTRHGPPFLVRPGMSADELFKYVGLLCKGATESIEPIHAIVMSRRSMTVCTDLNHLASVGGAPLVSERQLCELAERGLQTGGTRIGA